MLLAEHRGFYVSADGMALAEVGSMRGQGFGVMAVRVGAVRAFGLLGAIIGVAFGCEQSEPCANCDEAEAGSSHVPAEAGSSHVPVVAGDAGSGGQGQGGGAPDLFAPECAEPLEFTSECSFEETCALLGCGDGTSQFDENGCLRRCVSSEDCGSGKRCRFTVLAATREECFGGSVVEGCTRLEDGCSCETSLDCATPDVCVDAEAFPATRDCDLEGLTCDQLEFFQAMAEFAQSSGSTEKVDTIEACLASIADRRVERDCP